MSRPSLGRARDSAPGSVANCEDRPQVGAEGHHEHHRQPEKGRKPPLEASRGPDSELLAHQEPEIEASDMDEQSLEDVVMSSKKPGRRVIPASDRKWRRRLLEGGLFSL